MKILFKALGLALTVMASVDVETAPETFEEGFYKFPSPDETSEYGEGFISPEYFEQYIVPGNDSTVLQNQTWFLYLYHSRCNIPQCKSLNENYQRLYYEFTNVQQLYRRDGLDNPFRDMSIGRVNCRTQKHKICDRLVYNRKFPMFVILHGDKAYDFFKGNLTVDYISKIIKDRSFIE